MTALAPYTVDEIDAHEDAPTTCDNCDWKGTARETDEIERCALTAGDPSPVGRCPECKSLCYIDKPDLAVALRDLVRASVAYVLATGSKDPAVIAACHGSLAAENRKATATLDAIGWPPEKG